MSQPILPGFHPDPSICRVGDEFFLVTSTFTWFPGVPIFRSTDLVTWEQIGNVLDRPSQLDLSATGSWSSLGVYAPTLRHHDGRFWMITTVTGENGSRNQIVTAEDPAGPWSEPIVVDIPGIDPDLAWDEDGNCWVHHSLGAVFRCRIDDSTGAVLDPPEPTWNGSGLHCPEAPHLLRRGDTWYLLIAEGGTERGHTVAIARGPSPTGPWEPCPANPILSHRSTSSPVQNTGHADLVDDADGAWWMVFLGVRPRGITPGFHVLGRETFLAPVEWVDGWPQVGELVDGPVPPAERDDFDGPALHPRWITPRRPPSEVARLDGRLTLLGCDATLDDPTPSFVGRRQHHLRMRVRATVESLGAAEAGLALVHDDTAHAEVALVGGEVVARARSGPFRQVLGRAPAPDGPVVLGIDTVDHVLAPDLVVLGFEQPDGSFTRLGELDGRHLSTEVVGGFIGRVVGAYAVQGDATVSGFEVEPLP